MTNVIPTTGPSTHDATILKRSHERHCSALQEMSEMQRQGHHCPSACASAASAWGSQKVMSIARYRSMAVESAARARSCWPVAAYSVPRPRWQALLRGALAAPGQQEVSAPALP